MFLVCLFVCLFVFVSICQLYDKIISHMLHVKIPLGTIKEAIAQSGSSVNHDMFMYKLKCCSGTIANTSLERSQPED